MEKEEIKEITDFFKKQYKIKYAEFARCLGTDPNQIGYWRSGRNKPASAVATFLRLLRSRPELIYLLKDMKRSK